MLTERKHSLVSISSCESTSVFSDKRHKITSLFEIPRPNKRKRALKRTLSLPAKNRPPELENYLNSKKMADVPPTDNEDEGGNHRNSEFKQGRVRNIKDQFEKVGIAYQFFQRREKPAKNKKDNRPYTIIGESEENIYEEISENHEKQRSRSLDEDFADVGEDALSFNSNQNPDIFIPLTSIVTGDTYPLYEEMPDAVYSDEPIYTNLPNYHLSENLDSDGNYKYVELIKPNNKNSENEVVTEFREDEQNEVENVTEKLDVFHFERKHSTSRSTKTSHRKNSKAIITKRKEREEGTIEGVNTSISVHEKILKFENFYKAKEKGEIEKYRKQLVHTIDEEIENMISDGYQEHDESDDSNELDKNKIKTHITEEVSNEVIYDIPYNYTNLIHSSEENIEGHYEAPPVFWEDDMKDIPSSTNHYEAPPEFCDKNTEDSIKFESISNTVDQRLSNLCDEDQFGEIIFEKNLENDSDNYFVEAYNKDNEELVINKVEISRHYIYPNNIKDIPLNGLVTQQDRDLNKSFVYINNLVPSTSENSLNESNSNRNRYSTTSGDSCFSFDDLQFVEEDQYENLQSKHNSLYVNKYGRETFCDDKGVVRIERIYMQPSDLESPKPNKYFEGFDALAPEMYEYIDVPTTPVTLPENEVKKNKLDYQLEEIISSEHKYVDNLRKIVEDYKPFIENHTDVNIFNKSSKIFGNIEELFAKQQDFLWSLDSGDGSLQEIIKSFIEFESLFKIYPKYISYKLDANFLVKELDQVLKERQVQLNDNDKLDLAAYLITPIQRLGKYKLLLENILTELEKEGKAIGSVKMALDIIKREMGKSNDAVAISSIRGCPIYEFGSFIMREKFFCHKPRRIELTVYLFEEIIVFATEDPKSLEHFFYFQSIKMSDLRINTFTNNDNFLQLIDYTKTKGKILRTGKYTFTLEAPSKKVKETWRQAIEAILWKQLENLKDTLQRSKSITPSDQIRPPVRPPKRKPRPKSAIDYENVSAVLRESSSDSTISSGSTLASQSTLNYTLPRTHSRESAKSAGSSKFYI